MARRRKRSKKQPRRIGFRHALIGLAVLVGVGVLAFAQNGLDEIASIINRDTTPTAKTDPVRTAAVPSLPRSMQAPAPKPKMQARAPRVEIPRPKRELASVARPQRPVRTEAPKAQAARPAVGLPHTPAALPTGLRPIRKPQEGNCACPYDLMINGAQCGLRSTYMTPGREKPACYR